MCLTGVHTHTHHGHCPSEAKQVSSGSLPIIRLSDVSDGCAYTCQTQPRHLHAHLSDTPLLLPFQGEV